jgi:hypothetical protein
LIRLRHYHAFWGKSCLWLLCPGLVAAGIEIAQGSGVWAIGLVLSGILLMVITPRPDTEKPMEDARNT